VHLLTERGASAMDEHLEKLQQLCKENPDLAKIVEAYTIMDMLERNARTASKVQNNKTVTSRNTSDISLTFRGKPTKLHKIR
jgi:hypothetical protein